jgi:hypothetical protein
MDNSPFNQKQWLVPDLDYGGFPVEPESSSSSYLLNARERESK